MVLGNKPWQVPVPQTQGTQPLTPRARPAPSIVPRSNNVQTIPTAPPAQLPSVQAQPEPEAEQPPPPPQPSLPLPPPPPVVRQPEPVLPAVFRGCWRGRVEEVDRMQRLPGGPHLGLWMPKTYLLCYRRVGNGPFKLTFTEAGVEGTSRITNTTGQLRVVFDRRQQLRDDARLFALRRIPSGSVWSFHLRGGRRDRSAMHDWARRHACIGRRVRRT